VNKNISIQLKAGFLIFVFAINSLIGFACAIGLDMGFNIHHEEEVTKISLHVHADGKKHLHHKEASKHHHDEKDTSKKDDCCKDKVVKLSQEDKAVPQLSKLIIPVFCTAFVAVYHTINIFYSSQVSTANKYYVRGHHPPIADIRISIQSFQI